MNNNYFANDYTMKINNPYTLLEDLEPEILNTSVFTRKLDFSSNSYKDLKFDLADEKTKLKIEFRKFKKQNKKIKYRSNGRYTEHEQFVREMYKYYENEIDRKPTVGEYFINYPPKPTLPSRAIPTNSTWAVDEGYESDPHIVPQSGDFDYNACKSMLTELRKFGISDIEINEDIFAKFKKMNVTPQSSWLFGEKTIVDGIEEKYGIIGDMKETFSSVKSAADKINNTDLNSIIDAVMESDKVQENASSVIKSIGSIVVFSSSLILYVRDPTNVKAGIMIVSFCAMMWFTQCLGSITILAKIVLQIQKLLTPDVQPQSFDDVPVTDILTTVLGSYFALTSGDISKLTTKIGILQKFKGGAEALSKSIVEVIQYVVNIVRVRFLDKHGLRLVSTSIIEIDLYIDEVMKIMDEEAKGTLMKTNENLVSLLALRQEGARLIKTTPSTKDTTGALTLVKNAYSNIGKLIRVFEARSVTNAGARQEPVGVVLQGGSGVGKSMLMEHVTSAFCATTLDASAYEGFTANRGNYVYNHQGENGYFDGYQPTTHVTYFDELLQARDVAGKPDGEPMTLVRMINSFEMALHFAELEKKGNIKFHSKMVIGTTNAKHFALESVTDRTAVIRRMHVKVIVVPKPEYCLDTSVDFWHRKFDFSKLDDLLDADGSVVLNDEGQPIKAMTPEHQLYYSTDDDGNPIGAPFEFEELMERIIQCYRDRKDYHRANTIAFAKTQELYRKKREETVLKEIPSGTQPQASAFYVKLEELKEESSNMYEKHIQARVRAIERWLFNRGNHVKNKLSLETMQNMIERFDNFMASIYIPESLKQMSFLERYALYCEDFDTDNMGHFEMGDFHNLVSDDDYLVIAQNGKMWAHPPHVVYSCLEKVSYWKRFQQMLPGVIFKIDWDSVALVVINYSLLFATWWTLAFSIDFFINLVKSFFPTFEIEPESFGHSDKMRPKMAAKPKYYGKPSELKQMINELQPQAGAHDQNGLDIAKSIVNSNVFYMFLTPPGQIVESLIGNIIFVKGRVAIMPYHYIVRLAEKVKEQPELIKSEIVLRKMKNPGVGDRDVELKCPLSDVLMSHATTEMQVANDLCAVEFPKQMAERRYIVPYFAKRDDYQMFTKNILFSVNDAGGNSMTGYATARDNAVVQATDTTPAYTIRDAYSYKSTLVSGDCGAPFFAYNPCVEKRKIFGIHVAGCTQMSIGYSAAVCQEDILALLGELPEQVLVLESPDMLLPQSKDFEYTQFLPLGTPRKVPVQGSATALRRSAIYGQYGFKPQTAPCKLIKFERNGQIIDPRRNAMMKYCYPKKFIPYGKLQSVSQSYTAFLEHVSDIDVERRLFTYKECLYGIPSDPDVSGINFKSSSGFSLKISDFDFKKYLAQNPPGTPLHEDAFTRFTQEFERWEAIYLSNTRPFWIYTDCLKDERKPIQKVLEGKTRKFSACEFFYQEMFIRYFGAFGAWMQKNRINNHCGIGVNVYSDEWNTIAQSLTQFDTDKHDAQVGAGDYSHFDGSEQEQIHLEILNVINRWYNDSKENQQVRYILWQDIINSRHVSGDCIYEYNGSMPSGNPFTTIINCMYNEFAFRLCWVNIGLPLREFDKKVFVIFYGDDNSFTVSREYRDVFNEITLQPLMDEIGLVYTTELKETATVAFRKIQDIEFLKRSFRWCAAENKFIAPLRLDVVLEIPCWTTKNNGINTTADNVVTTMRELALHPQDVYNKWMPRLRESFEKNYPSVMTTEPLHSSYLTMRETTLKSSWALP